jgi:hypothetical protein
MQENHKSCIVCKKSSQLVPLIALQYQSQEYYICPEHFPLLIHQPEKLSGILPGADKLQGHTHE